MFEKLAPRLLKKYRLRYVRIYPVQKGYRNESYKVCLENDQLINLYIHKAGHRSFKGIQVANEVSNYLYSKGMPVRKCVDDRVLQVSSPGHIRYVTLYNYLPGRTIPWEAYTRSHIKLIGKSMSQMHAHLKNHPLKYNDQVTISLDILARMKRYFSDNAVEKAASKKLHLKHTTSSFERLEQIITMTAHLPGQHMLHMDYVRGNLLFASPKKSSENTSAMRLRSVELTGIIDFEKTGFGHPVLDIARTLAFLYVDCPHYSEKKIQKYFLTSGYNMHSASSFKKPVVNRKNKKYDVLEDCVNFYLLYDFYKFLKHNPYEFLERNHHYKRTRDILIRRNMLEYTN